MVGGSEWRVSGQRTGEGYGFKAPAAFTESQAYYSYNEKWIKHYVWEKGTDYGFSNWRVVLHTKDDPADVSDDDTPPVDTQTNSGGGTLPLQGVALFAVMFILRVKLCE